MTSHSVPLMTLDDLRGARRQDRDALLTIYRACASIARRAVWMNRLPVEEVADIQQSAYVEAVERIRKLRPKPEAPELAVFVRELIGAGERLAKRARRRYEREVSYSESDVARYEVDRQLRPTQEDHEAAESIVMIIGPIIENALEAMRPRERELLRECYYSLATAAELQAFLGLRSPGAVYTALSRARKSFGAHLLTGLEQMLVNPDLDSDVRSRLEAFRKRLTTVPPTVDKEDE